MYTRSFSFYNGSNISFSFNYTPTPETSEKNKISEINLSHRLKDINNAGVLGEIIFLADENSRQTVKSLIEKIQQKLIANGIKKNLLGTRYDTRDTFMTFDEVKNEPYERDRLTLTINSSRCKVEEFMLIIESLKEEGVIDQETADVMNRDLNFPVTKNQVKQMLTELAEINIDEAKQKAREWNDKFQSEDAIWMLAKYLKKQGNNIDSIDLYQDIPKENTHYDDAIDEIKETISGLLSASDRGEVKLSPEEIRKYKEDLFVLSSETSDRSHTSLLYFDLCGLGLQANPREIKPDMDTLLFLSREMTKLNQTIAEQKAKIAELEEKNKSTFRLFDEKSERVNTPPDTTNKPG